MLNWTANHDDRTGPDPAYDRCRDGPQPCWPDRTWSWPTLNGCSTTWPFPLSSVDGKLLISNRKYDRAFLADTSISCNDSDSFIVIMIRKQWSVYTECCIQNQILSSFLFYCLFEPMPLKALKLSLTALMNMYWMAEWRDSRLFTIFCMVAILPVCTYLSELC